MLWVDNRGINMNVNYNLDFNKHNLEKLIEKLNTELNTGINQTLENALIQASREIAQAQDMVEIEEMKKYEYSCEIEMYPLVQYIEANTAEEAVEIMEREIEDTAFLQDLDKRDFHCEVANQVKMTKEYKEYVDKHKIKIGETS
jgi:hypothetical protein